MRSVLLDPGRLSHPLALETATAVADGLGGWAVTWRETALVHGMIEPVSARSLLRADQRLALVTHRITIRHRDGVESGMRLVKGGVRRFVIRTVHDPDESGRYLVCHVEEETQ